MIAPNTPSLVSRPASSRSPHYTPPSSAAGMLITQSIAPGMRNLGRDAGVVMGYGVY